MGKCTSNHHRDIQTFALPDDSKIESDITDFVNWLLTPCFELYEEKIGFANVPTKLWPTSKEAEILMKKVNEISPGLAGEAFGLQKSLDRRLYNVNRKRKAKLGIVTSKGMHII